MNTIVQKDSTSVTYKCRVFKKKLAQHLPTPPTPVGQGLHINDVLDHTHTHTHTHTDAPQSVGLLWTSDQPVAETSDNTQHSQQTDRHAPGAIRTYNISRRAAADLRP